MKVNQERRKLQLEAVQAIQQANFKGFLILPTGSGKGWCMIECLKRISPKGRIWYLCESEDNRDVTFKKDLERWGMAHWIDRIEFMCYQSAYKLSGEDVELCLADEADYALTPEYIKALTENNFRFLVCASATLEDKKRALAKSIVPIVFERTLKQIEDAGILNGARHFIVNFSLNEKENKKYLEFNSRFVRLLDESNRNTKRLEMLQIERKHFLSSLDTAKNVCRRLLKDLYGIESNKILIFCGLTNQAEAICKYSYHSNSTENYLPAFDAGEIRTLSVVGKIDRGVNLSEVNNIIFESPTRSATKFVQRSGRGRRLDVDDLLDIYYLIPYFRDHRGTLRPTKVRDWVYQATEKINFHPQIYQFK